MDEEKVKLAKQYRERGMTYFDIGEKLGVSDTMASNYVNGYGYKVHKCNVRNNNGLVCQRPAGYRGIHLSDEDDLLIYWES